MWSDLRDPIAFTYSQRVIDRVHVTRTGPVRRYSHETDAGAACRVTERHKKIRPWYVFCNLYRVVMFQDRADGSQVRTHENGR
jgi:hypothetical protein